MEIDTIVYAVIGFVLLYAFEFSIIGIIVVAILVIWLSTRSEHFRVSFGAIDYIGKYTGWTPNGGADTYPDVYDESKEHVYPAGPKGLTTGVPSRMAGSPHDDPLIERFEQLAPEDITAYADNGLIADDNGQFNDTYWSSAMRENGIMPGSQVDLTFDEGVAFASGQQMTPNVNHDSNWQPLDEPQGHASDFFDVSGEYSTTMDDPRQVISHNRGPYSKQVDADDLLDLYTRERNDRQMTQYATHGITRNAREILDTVFAPDLQHDEQLTWWGQYEV